MELNVKFLVAIRKDMYNVLCYFLRLYNYLPDFSSVKERYSYLILKDVATILDMDDLRISVLCNDIEVEQMPCNILPDKRMKENIQMTENFSVTECSLDVLAPNTTDGKVKGLTIQVRKYFCFKLSDSMLRNFRNSDGMTNLNLAKENIQYIARNKEFYIFQESKTIVEYKVSMIKQTFEFENYAIDKNLSQILKLQNADFLKEIDQWESYFNVRHNRCNIALQPQLNKFNHITKPSKDPVINKFRNHSTYNKSSQILRDMGNEVPNCTVSTESVDCPKENNEVRRSKCLRIIDNVLLSTSIAKKCPILPSTREKKNTNNTTPSGTINTNTDKIQNLKHIENEIGNNHHLQGEKSDSIANEKDKASCEPLFQKQEENLTCSPCKKRPRLENDLQLEPSDPHIWTKQSLKMLKLILKNYNKTPYIPNKHSYEMICRKIFTDILDKRIYEQEHLKLYAEDAIKSKKYLQE